MICCIKPSPFPTLTEVNHIITKNQRSLKQTSCAWKIHSWSEWKKLIYRESGIPNASNYSQYDSNSLNTGQKIRRKYKSRFIVLDVLKQCNCINTAFITEVTWMIYDSSHKYAIFPILSNSKLPVKWKTNLTAIQNAQGHTPFTNVQNQLPNTLRLEYDGQFFADDIFKCIFFFNKNVGILIHITLKFILKGPIDKKSTLVQVMTC